MDLKMTVDEISDGSDEEELYDLDLGLLEGLETFAEPLITQNLGLLIDKLNNFEEEFKDIMASTLEAQNHLAEFNQKLAIHSRSSNAAAPVTNGGGRGTVTNGGAVDDEDDDMVEIVSVLPPTRPAIPNHSNKMMNKAVTQSDSSADIIHVGQVAMTRPDIPQIGLVTRKPLRDGSCVFYQLSNRRNWVEGIVRRVRWNPSSFQEYELESEIGKWYPPTKMAYSTPPTVVLPVGTRILGRYKEEAKTTLLSGIVAEPPKVMNKFRYLVFFDEGYAQYLDHHNIYLMCHSNKDIWDEMAKDTRDFIRNYLKDYPERPMLKLQRNQIIKTEHRGEWLIARVEEVDASLVKMQFYVDSRIEWIYRGSMRLGPLFSELQAAESNRLSGKGRRHSLLTKRPSQPYVEYTRGLDEPIDPSDTVTMVEPLEDTTIATHSQKPQFAKKHTGFVPSRPVPIAPKPSQPTHHTSTASSVLFDRGWMGERKNLLFTLEYQRVEFMTHTCNSSCLQGRYDQPDIHSGKSFLCIPIYFGWERHAMRPKKMIEYRAPCGRILNNIQSIYYFLKVTGSKLAVDYFTFDYDVDITREFVTSGVKVNLPDITYGKEKVPVGAVNAINKEFPPYVEYATQRSATKNVPLNLDPSFLCGCDCTDDCSDVSKCQCQQLTQTAAHNTDFSKPVGYQFRRLRETLLTGIYECNSTCSCRDNCLNRVAQNGLRNRLQVFKTEKRGWGIRSLDDIPQGMFICIYAGQLLTEQGADEDGNTYGDEYFAELDHIEVVEKHKEGYESDAYESDNGSSHTDRKEGSDQSSSLSSISSSEEDKDDHSDVDDDTKDANYMLPHSKFQPTIVGPPRYSTRSKANPPIKEEVEPQQRKPVQQAPPPRTKKKTKKKVLLPKKQPGEPRKPLRSYYGEDSCYIMDAKSAGNIGRYLNHSCDPNVVVQNVFVDTHDLRFPWVAFFAFKFIPAGTELTWDYNYEIGSVPGKNMYCFCGAEQCRGRLI